ncbi:MAG: hypothetical protein AAB211_09340 [Pseudomonadota bacterium]
MHEDFIRFASFEQLTICTASNPSSSWTASFEMMPPNTALSKRRLEKLRSMLKQGLIRKLKVSWGICYAEYYNSVEGWTHHELLNYADFDEQFIDDDDYFWFVDRLGKRSAKQDYGTLKRLREKAAQPKLKSGNSWVEDIKIKFGKRLPEDYYGDHIYDPLYGYTGLED